MTRKYFGTDGIRGQANRQPMDVVTALKLGMAAGAHFTRGDHRHRVVIGKDTRLSGYMVEPALTSGFVSMGMDVVLVGPMPTPAVSFITRSLRADLGVMISASHNPFQDNGIKLFCPEGMKLSDEVERKLEQLMDSDMSKLLAPPDKLGRAMRLDDAPGRYIEYVKNTFPKSLRLEGLKIALDCANGAAYKLAPTVLWELGAEIIPLSVKPDGFNINSNCGSTVPELIQDTVKQTNADIGIALDGDADRVIICDENSELIDGDQIMAAIATNWQAKGLLKGGGIVATVMSNLGLERYLESQGLKLERTQVGDRYVTEKMRESGYNLGGENSGHIIFNDYTTTGDGLVAALQVLAAIVEQNKPASKVLHVFKPYPQKLVNIRYDKSAADPLKNQEVKQIISDTESELGDKGRILIRKSGTEPLIRVMAESDNEQTTNEATEKIASKIREIIGDTNAELKDAG